MVCCLLFAVYIVWPAAAAMEQQYSRTDKLIAAFHKLDLDGGGSISIDELKQLLPPDISEASSPPQHVCFWCPWLDVLQGDIQ